MVSRLSFGVDPLKKKTQNIANNVSTTARTAINNIANSPVSSVNQPKVEVQSPLQTSQKNTTAARSTSALKNLATMPTTQASSPALSTINNTSIASPTNINTKSIANTGLNDINSTQLTSNLKPVDTYNSAKYNPTQNYLKQQNTNYYQNALGDKYSQIVGNTAATAGMAGNSFAPVMKEDTGYNKRWFDTTGQYKVDNDKIGQNYENFTYEKLLDSYNNASDKDRAEVKANLQRSIATLKANYEQTQDQNVLNNINTLNELNRLINSSNLSSKKTLGQKLGDYVGTGGITKSYYNDLLRGWSDKDNDNVKLQNQLVDITRSDLGALGVSDTILKFLSDYSLNTATKGSYNALKAINNSAKLMSDMADTDGDFYKKWAYDNNGNLVYRDKTDTEVKGDVGKQVVEDLWSIITRDPKLSNMMPGLDVAGKSKSDVVKEIAKYVLKETPFALGTTELDRIFENMSEGKSWNQDFKDIISGDSDTRKETLKDFGKDYAQTFAVDAAVDTGSALRGMAEYRAAKNGEDISGLYSKNGELISPSEVANKVNDILPRLGMTIEDVSKRDSQISEIDKQIAQYEKKLKNARDVYDVREYGKAVNDLKAQREALLKSNDSELGITEDKSVNESIKKELSNDEDFKKLSGQETKQVEEVSIKAAEENKKIAGQLNTEQEQKASDLLANKVAEVTAKSEAKKKVEASRTDAKNKVETAKTETNQVSTEETDIKNIVSKDAGTFAKEIDSVVEKGLLSREEANDILDAKSTYDTLTKDAIEFNKMGDYETARESQAYADELSRYIVEGLSKTKQASEQPKQDVKTTTPKVGAETKLKKTVPEENIVKEVVKSDKIVKQQIETKQNNVTKAETEKNTAKKTTNKTTAVKNNVDVVKPVKNNTAKTKNAETKNTKTAETNTKKEATEATGATTDYNGRSGEEKVSTHSLKDSKNKKFSKELKDKISENLAKYQATTDVGRLEAAEKWIESGKANKEGKYSVEDEIISQLKSGKDDGTAAIAADRLIQKYDEEGKHDRAEFLDNVLSSQSSVYGQKLNALRQIAATPEGLARKARKIIEDAAKETGNEVPKTLRKDTAEISKKIDEHDKEVRSIAKQNEGLTKNIYECRKQIEELSSKPGNENAVNEKKKELAENIAAQNLLGSAYKEASINKANAINEMCDYVKRHTPNKTGAIDALSAIYRANMLTSPITHTGNILSNSIQHVIESTNRYTAAQIESVVSKITHDKRTIAYDGRGRLRGFIDGLKDAERLIKTGTSNYESSVSRRGQKYEGNNEIRFKNKFLDNTAGKYTRGVMRLMSAGDLPFRYSAYEMGLRSEAKLDGINAGLKGTALEDYIRAKTTAPSADLQDRAVKIANKYVYDYDTLGSKMIDSVRNSKYAQNPIAKAVGTVVAPFVKVPSAVASATIDMTPVGGLLAMSRKYVNKGTDFAGNKYTDGDFMVDLVKSASGSSILGLGAALYLTGAWNGDYPDDQEERARWEAEGIQPNTIKIGDYQFSTSNAGTLGAVMGYGANFANAVTEGKGIAEALVESSKKFIVDVISDSPVGNIKDYADAIIDEDGKAANNIISNMVGNVVPALVSKSASSTDSKQRVINKDSLGEQVVDTVKSKIPGLRQTLDAKVDVYGNEVKNNGTYAAMIDPLKTTKVIEQNDVGKEIDRLKDAGVDDVIPNRLGGSLQYDKNTYSLSSKQLTQYKKDAGQAKTEAMRKVMNTKEYKYLTDEQKAAALAEAQSEVLSSVKESFTDANNMKDGENSGTANSGLDNVSYYDIARKSVNKGKNGYSDINATIPERYQKILVDKKNMSKEDWDARIKNNNKAEYEYALAKYENDIATGDLSEEDKASRQKTLKKMKVQSDYSYDTREAYGLSSSKTKMQDYLNNLDDDTRESKVEELNALNRAMYDSGVITASTYRSRFNAINNTTSSGSGRSGSGTTSATSAKKLASALANTSIDANKGTRRSVTTKRQMKATSLIKSGKLSSATSSAKKISVKKGIA